MFTYSELRKWMVLSPPPYIPWRSTVQSALGQRPSRFTGQGGEWVDTRPLRPGDPISRIDWHAFAKTRKHHVRLFETEMRIVVHVIVDVESLTYGTQELSKLELATVLTGSIIGSVAKTKDNARLHLVGQDRVRKTLPPRGQMEASRLLPLAVTAMLEDGRTCPRQATVNSTGLTEALSTLPNTKSLVCIVSGSPILGAGVADALKRASLGQGHHVVWFGVHDLREAELPYVPLKTWLPLPGMYDLLLADGSVTSVLTTAGALKAHRAAFRTKQDELHTALAASRVKWCHFCTDEKMEALWEHQIEVLQSTRPSGSLDTPEESVDSLNATTAT